MMGPAKRVRVGFIQQCAWLSIGLLFLALLTSGCSDDNKPPMNTPDTSDSPTPNNNTTQNNAIPTIAAPVADFNVNTVSAKAGDVLRFDATSTVSESTQLLYAWDFGNGKRGGSARIAQIFSQPGTFTVSLTVSDEFGQSNTKTREITIAENPVPEGDATFTIEVLNAQGTPLENVQVSVSGLPVSAKTDGQGIAILDGLPKDHALALRFSKAGYADQFLRTQIGSNEDSPLDTVRMLAIDSRVQVKSIESGGVATAKNGARVVFPENSVVDNDGKPVTGDIEVAITLFDVSTKEYLSAFPGFDAINSEGEESILVSHGAMDVVLSKEDERLQIAHGKAATIDIPIYTEGYQIDASIDLWSFDESTALWIQEGNGTVVASADSPTGVVLRGQATHFSLWNADTWISTPCELKVQLTCTDSNGNEVPLGSREQSAATGTLMVYVEPVPGFGDDCKPLDYERHAPNYVESPSNSILLEGQRCTDAWGGESTCKAKDGNVPPDVTCKESPFWTTCTAQEESSFPPLVGFCTRDQQTTQCPNEFMYCEPFNGNPSGGRCTVPFYRHSTLDNYVRLRDGTHFWACHDDDSELLRDDELIQVISQQRIPYFQNWNGFMRTRRIDNNGMVYFDRIPRTYFSLVHSKIEAGQMTYEQKVYDGELAVHDGKLLPNPGGEPNSAGQMLQDIGSAQCFHDGPDVLEWSVGACQPDPCKVCCVESEGQCEDPEILGECQPEPIETRCDPETDPDSCEELPDHCILQKETCSVCCVESEGQCEDPEILEGCSPAPIEDRCDRTQGEDCTDLPDHCIHRGNIKITCNNLPLGVNDVEGYCEIDALIIERGAESIKIKSITVDNPHPEQSNADLVDIMQQVGFTTCDPDTWVEKVVLVESTMWVDFEKSLQTDDILRIYRQGVPAHQMNEEGQRCQAQGTLNVYLGDQPIATDRMNTFDLRIPSINAN